jgi:ribosome modulation factor
VTDDERTKAAFARLQAVLTDVASRMVGKIHERCPYRARDDRCTFAGGCRNQRREARGAPDGERAVWCGGDHLLRRTGK